LIVALVVSTLSAFAQAVKGKATITITNDQNTTLEGITVELLRSKDSGLVKTALTDKAGLVEFDNVKPGSYLVRAGGVSYASGYSAAFAITE
jgi:uncharacterized surface anchored protein